MTELNKALAEIQLIRGQLARSAVFRGYGPTTVAATGLLAILAASAQSHWIHDSSQNLVAYLAIWVATAAVSMAVICGETIFRARRVHSGLATDMVQSALQQFFPPIVAGLLLTIVLWRYAPQCQWMLPGLWQVLFSMGVFASCRLLPRGIFAVGLWYLAAGLFCLALGGTRALAPWAMGIPFGVGQLLVAGVLHFAYRNSDEAWQ